MNFSTDNEAAAEAGEVLILAVKPHLYSGVLEKLEVLQNVQKSWPFMNIRYIIKIGQNFL